jgi:hypothetical protein
VGKETPNFHDMEKTMKTLFSKFLQQTKN